MAYNFSANQFEGSFKPKKLGNWEVAKWFPERPRAHRTATKIIADDRGHLLPGVQRAPSSPWGDFRGTWQLPKKISRKTAEELNKPFTRARQSWVKRSSHVPIITPQPSPECPEEEKDDESRQQQEKEGGEEKIDECLEEIES